MRCDASCCFWFALAAVACSLDMPHRAATISAAEPQGTAAAGISDRDWPSWRGPSHDGHAAAPQTVPIIWSDTENVVWSADVPGRGSSSPTVLGDRVYVRVVTGTGDLRKEKLVCIGTP